MIRLRISATGAALAIVTLAACRDAPTVPIENTQVATDVATDAWISSDSVPEMPGPAEIRYAYTGLSFYDGSRGGEPLLEISVATEYRGNRAEISTAYAITGEITRNDRIVNFQNSFYNPFLWKRWDEIYQIPTVVDCGMSADANTQHRAWWDVWFRGIAPNWDSGRVLRFTTATAASKSCEPKPPPDEAGGGGGTGGWINIETCYYWAHYVNGVLVDIELRYCTYDQVPVADE